MSSLLYNFYINDLLLQLQKSGIGTTIGEIFVGSPVVADDVALTASPTNELQTLINTATNYSHCERYQFQPSKCEVTNLGHPDPTPVMFYIDNEPLSSADSISHVGL